MNDNTSKTKWFISAQNQMKLVTDSGERRKPKKVMGLWDQTVHKSCDPGGKKDQVEKSTRIYTSKSLPKNPVNLAPSQQHLTPQLSYPSECNQISSCPNEIRRSKSQCEEKRLQKKMQILKPRLPISNPKESKRIETENYATHERPKESSGPQQYLPVPGRKERSLSADAAAKETEQKNAFLTFPGQRQRRMSSLERFLSSTTSMFRGHRKEKIQERDVLPDGNVAVKGSTSDKKFLSLSRGTLSLYPDGLKKLYRHPRKSRGRDQLCGSSGERTIEKNTGEPDKVSYSTQPSHVANLPVLIVTNEGEIRNGSNEIQRTRTLPSDDFKTESNTLPPPGNTSTWHNSQKDFSAISMSQGSYSHGISMKSKDDIAHLRSTSSTPQSLKDHRSSKSVSSSNMPSTCIAPNDVHIKLNSTRMNSLNSNIIEPPLLQTLAPLSSGSEYSQNSSSNTPTTDFLSSTSGFLKKSTPNISTASTSQTLKMTENSSTIKSQTRSNQERRRDSKIVPSVNCLEKETDILNVHNIHTAGHPEQYSSKHGGINRGHPTTKVEKTEKKTSKTFLSHCLSSGDIELDDSSTENTSVKFRGDDVQRREKRGSRRSIRDSITSGFDKLWDTINAKSKDASSHSAGSTGEAENTCGRRPTIRNKKAGDSTRMSTITSLDSVLRYYDDMVRSHSGNLFADDEKTHPCFDEIHMARQDDPSRISSCHFITRDTLSPEIEEVVSQASDDLLHQQQCHPKETRGMLQNQRNNENDAPNLHEDLFKERSQAFPPSLQAILQDGIERNKESDYIVIKSNYTTDGKGVLVNHEIRSQAHPETVNLDEFEEIDGNQNGNYLEERSDQQPEAFDDKPVFHEYHTLNVDDSDCISLGTSFGSFETLNINRSLHSAASWAPDLTGNLTEDDNQSECMLEVTVVSDSGSVQDLESVFDSGISEYSNSAINLVSGPHFRGHMRRRTASDSQVDPEENVSRKYLGWRDRSVPYRGWRYDREQERKAASLCNFSQDRKSLGSSEFRTGVPPYTFYCDRLPTHENIPWLRRASADGRGWSSSHGAASVSTPHLIDSAGSCGLLEKFPTVTDRSISRVNLLQYGNRQDGVGLYRVTPPQTPPPRSPSTPPFGTREKSLKYPFLTTPITTGTIPKKSDDRYPPSYDETLKRRILRTSSPLSSPKIILQTPEEDYTHTAKIRHNANNMSDFNKATSDRWKDTLHVPASRAFSGDCHLVSGKVSTYGSRICGGSIPKTHVPDRQQSYCPDFTYNRCGSNNNVYNVSSSAEKELQQYSKTFLTPARQISPYPQYRSHGSLDIQLPSRRSPSPKPALPPCPAYHSMKPPMSPTLPQSPRSVSTLPTLTTRPPHTPWAKHSATTNLPLKRNSRRSSSFSVLHIPRSSPPAFPASRTDLPSVASRKKTWKSLDGLETAQMDPTQPRQYDIRLGYLCHTFQTPEINVSIYSLQRNKQYMDELLGNSSRVTEGIVVARDPPRELPKTPRRRSRDIRTELLARISPQRDSDASSSRNNTPTRTTPPYRDSSEGPSSAHNTPTHDASKSGTFRGTPARDTPTRNLPARETPTKNILAREGSPAGTPTRYTPPCDTPGGRDSTPRVTPQRELPVRESSPLETVRRRSLSRGSSFDSPPISSRRDSFRNERLRLRSESQDTGEDEELEEEEELDYGERDPIGPLLNGNGKAPGEDQYPGEEGGTQAGEEEGEENKMRNRLAERESLEKDDVEAEPTTSTMGSSYPRRAPSARRSRRHKMRIQQQKSQDLDSPSNAGMPIVEAPSDGILEAAWVLRTLLLARSPHLIRDRRHHGRWLPCCSIGTELTDFLMAIASTVHSRQQAASMWQVLLEEGALMHVCNEQPFRDKYVFYRFLEDAKALHAATQEQDEEGAKVTITQPTQDEVREAEDRLSDILVFLHQRAPDATLRMILRKPSHERTSEDQELIYEELLHIKALAHLTTSVKRELASVIVFESHPKKGTILFQQGSEGKSWYVILRGSVNVVIHGKGVVNSLSEGEDFGKLALVNDAPRAATIEMREDNCHFLRVDKSDFNRILRDVEANTVRLKEHGQDVLVLEKISSNSHSHYKYSVMAGTPQKMLEHLLETRLDGRGAPPGVGVDISLRRPDLATTDLFLDDFLLTHIVFMPYAMLSQELLRHYRIDSEGSNNQDEDFVVACKKRVIQFVHRWVTTIREPVFEDSEANQFLQTLQEEIAKDVRTYGTALRDEANLMVGVAEMMERYEREGKAGGIRKWKLPSSGRAVCLFGASSIEEESSTQHRVMRSDDDIIFRVYCADHTYCTLRFSLHSTAESIRRSAADKLGLRNENLLLVELKSTGESMVIQDSEVSVSTGLSLNGQLFISHKDHLDALTPLQEQEGPSESSVAQLEMYSTRELAYHITTHDWDLFTAIHEYELLYQVFGRCHFGRVMSNLDVFLRRFNELQYWVVTEICLANNLSKRASLLRKFIKLAAYCKEQQNLNAFFAIVIGLSNVAVSRLTQTWERLSSRFRKMYTEFEMLIDPSRNHRLYRSYVGKLQPPILPFMPLLMKDMTFTHEGNKTYLDGLVNFEKMHMMATTMRTCRFCRSKPLALDVPPVPKNEQEIRVYVRNFHVIDNQRRLLSLSSRLEPKRT